jgi:tRNA threonylcarbamoyladenosine biosynthesis protein TsaB
VKLLAIDTATEYCSVALWNDAITASRTDSGPQTAAALVLDMVAACLAEAGVALGALDAIAFGRGPGGFTGVRLAASVTQGLAFASGLPALPVSNLRAVAQHALARQAGAVQLLICQDARMGELYWAAFDACGGFAEPAGTERVGKPAAVVLPDSWQPSRVTGAGSGFALYPELARLARALPGCHSRAEDIARLAVHEGLSRAVPAEQALPVYVRDNVAVPGRPR